MYYSESDESDQEWISSNSNEIDVERLYLRLCSGNIFCNNQSRKLKRSVVVQTEPEIGNIPPSWLLAGERLIDELYTGLGNVINTMYHNDQVLSRRWLPSFTIRDSSVTRPNSPLDYEDTRKNLQNLLQTATQLRCIIPFLSDLATCKDQQTVDEKIQSFFNRDQTQDSPKSNPTPDSDTSDSDMVIEDEVHCPDIIVGQRPPTPWRPRPAIIVDSPDGCGISDGNPAPKRVKKELGQRDPLGKDPLGLRFGSDEIPGLKISRFSDTSDSDMVIDNLSEDEMHRPAIVVGQKPPALRQPLRVYGARKLMEEQENTYFTTQQGNRQGNWPHENSGQRRPTIHTACPAIVVDSPDSCGISDGNPAPKRVRKEWGQRDPLGQDLLGLRFGSDEIPRLKISKFAHCKTYDSCNRSKKAQKLREKDLNVYDCASRHPVDQNTGVLAGCSNIKPSTGSNQGFTLKVMKKNRINDTTENRKNIAVAQKNFIRKNIMELKKKSNREVPVETDGFHLEARGSSRNLHASSSCATVCKKQCR